MSLDAKCGADLSEELGAQLILEYGERCKVCPRLCGADRVHWRGVCHADVRMEIAHVQLHHWEEPPISGEAGSGTVFFRHCNLGCVYCQNHRISDCVGASCAGDASGADCLDGLSNAVLADVKAAADIYLALQGEGAMNINLVTPTHYAPSVRASILHARELGLLLPVVWNTSGYELSEQIRMNEGLVDVYLTDMKYADSDLAASLSGARNYVESSLRAIDEMVERTHPLSYDDFNGVERLISGVVVRHMLLPGHLDDSMRVVEMLNSRYGQSVRLSIMNQYTPVLSSRSECGDDGARQAIERFPELVRSVEPEEYERLLDYADSLGVEDYFWQDGSACAESFIPNF